MPTFEEMQRYARDVAAPKYGIDPDVFVRGLGYEGLGEGQPWQSGIYNNGTRERSYGPGQLNTDVGLGRDFKNEYPGLDITNPNTWRENLDFTAKNVAKSGWGPWHGPTKVGGFSQWFGVKPGGTASPRGSTLAPGGNNMDLNALFGGGGNAPPGLMAPEPDNSFGGKLTQGLMSPLTQFGLGMMSQGKTVVGQGPTGMGAALQRGSLFAQKAEQDRQMMELKRQKAAADSYMDPYKMMQMLGLQGQIEDRTRTANQEKAQLRTGATLAYTAADDGWRAATELQKSPIGGQIAAMSPEYVNKLRLGVEFAKGAGGDSSMLGWAKGKLAELGGVAAGLDLSTPEGIASADAIVGNAETLNKARDNAATQLQALATGGSQSAQALLARSRGFGKGAGLDVNINIFGDLRDAVAEESKAYGLNFGGEAPQATQQEAAAPALAPTPDYTVPTTAAPVPSLQSINAGMGMPPSPAAAGAYSGPVAVGPNGQRLRLNNEGTAWVPM